MNYLFGIGNCTRGDDGIGPRLVEAICERHLDTSFTALELPGHGIDLITHFTPDTRHVLVIDCALMGLPPGHFRLFAAPPTATPPPPTTLSLSTHQNDILSLIAYARAAGCTIPELHILAIQPAQTSLSQDLSPTLQAHFESYIRIACTHMHTLAHTATHTLPTP